MSNISFTVYALLPTLSTQLLSHLNVEALTDELKGIAAASAAQSSKPPRMTDSGMASWAASSESDVTSKSLESSAVLSSNEGERETEESPASKANDTTTGLGIHTGSQGQAQSSSSWVQEFNTTQSTVSTAMESDMSDMGATSAGEEGVSRNQVLRGTLLITMCRIAHDVHRVTFDQPSSYFTIKLIHLPVLTPRSRRKTHNASRAAIPESARPRRIRFIPRPGLNRLHFRVKCIIHRSIIGIGLVPAVSALAARFA